MRGAFYHRWISVVALIGATCIPGDVTGAPP